MKFIPQVQAQDRMAGRSQERILEETADVHAPQVAERSEVARLVTQEPAQNRAMEQIVDRPVHRIRKEFGEMIQSIPARKNFRFAVGEHTYQVRQTRKANWRRDPALSARTSF